MKSALIVALISALEFVNATTTPEASVTHPGATHTPTTPAKGSNIISASVPMNSMTITIGIIFILQLLFCFGICVYTNGQVQKAEKNATVQQAEFYQFLYQFHKQMADEEQ